MKKSIMLTTIIVLCSLLAFTPCLAGGKKDLTRAVVNIQHLYGDLGGEWWEWAFDTDFEMFAQGKVDCSIGQSGQVWFLTGTFGDPAERSCTIPQGKSLFIPLVNYFIFYEEGVDPEELDLTLKEKRIFLDGLIGGGSLSKPKAVKTLAEAFGYVSTVACDLHATLDGKPLVLTTPIVRGQSSPFTMTTDDEALADGIYALIAPLDKGLHELEFGGALCDVSTGERTFETTVIYTLNVKKKGRHHHRH